MAITIRPKTQNGRMLLALAKIVFLISLVFIIPVLIVLYGLFISCLDKGSHRY
jgi:hypothetical protein